MERGRRGTAEMAPIAGVTGSKYDARSGTADDDFKGCFDTGCKPELLIVSAHAMIYLSPGRWG